jgi:hypothetical protein
LLHGEKRHVMRRAVGEAEALLGVAHRIREDAAAGDDDRVTAASGERGQASVQTARAG